MLRNYLWILVFFIGTTVLVVFLAKGRRVEPVAEAENIKDINKVTSNPPARTPEEPIISFAVSAQAPYVFDSNKETPGFLIEIIKEIFEKEDYRVKIQFYPWGRGLVELRLNHVDGIIGVLKRNAPELIYPQEEIGSRNYHFYTSDGLWRYRGLRSLREQTIGLTYGVSYGILDSYIKRYEKDHKKIRFLHGENVTVRKIKMLSLNRIGAFLEDRTVLDYHLKRVEIDKAAGKNISKTSLIPSGTIPKDNIYVAFAPENSRSPEYAQIVTRGMTRLRDSGRLKEIMGKYGQSDWHNSVSPGNVTGLQSHRPIVPRATQQANMTILFAGSTAKYSSGYWKYAQKFKEILEASSQGKMQVELQFGEKSEHDIVMDLSEDKIEMGMIATNNLTPFAPSLEVLTFPYLFPTIASMKKLLLSSYMKTLAEKSTQESGVRAISWYIGGFRYLANKLGPIKSTIDLRGIKIRVPRNQVMVETFRSWNLETYPLAWPNVFPSIESGLIHGMENPLNIMFSGLNMGRPIWESLPYITKIRYFVFTAPHLVSASYFQSLKEADQVLILNAARQAQTYSWDDVQQEERELVNLAQSKGMRFDDPENETGDWRAKAIQIWPRFYNQVGGKKVIDKIQEIIETTPRGPAEQNNDVNL